MLTLAVAAANSPLYIPFHIPVGNVHLLVLQNLLRWVRAVSPATTYWLNFADWPRGMVEDAQWAC
jgi:hypothetical protein